MHSPTLSSILTPFLVEQPHPERAPHVFCDMDGVLADFRATVRRLYNATTKEEIEAFLNTPGAWDKVKQEHPHIFRPVSMMPDAKTLMTGLLRLRDTGFIRLSILTAIPAPWYADPTQRAVVTNDKIQWIHKHFPEAGDIDVNVCLRKEKVDFAIKERAGSHTAQVLIDDYNRNTKEWSRQGKGIGILYVSARQTLNDLHKYVVATTEG